MRTFILFATLAFSFNSLAQIQGSYINSYGSHYIERINECRKYPDFCTKEDQISTLQFDGKVLDKAQLDQILAENNERSLFIPLSLTNEELLVLAAGTSLGIVAFLNDQQIMDTVQKNKTQVTQKLETVGNFLGGGAYIPIAAGSYFLGLMYENGKLKQAGLFTVGASIAGGIVSTVVKEIFQRSRPKEDRGPYDFLNPGNKSFFSGHTTEAFSIATVFSELYKNEYPVVPYVAYGLATITAYARMHDQAHWASDVIAGAVAGHLITKLFLSVFKKDHDGRAGLMIYPTYDVARGMYILNFEYIPKSRKAEMRCAKIQDHDQRVSACMEEAFTSEKP